MIIKGNTVGTPMPRTNYEQTDPSKADYLKGKEVLDQKIEDAKSAGVNAASNAQNAVDQHSENNGNPHGVTTEQIGAAPMDYVKKVGNPYNYLVNSDFTNPVNYGGQTRYAVAGYTIDKWKTTSPALVVEVVDGGLKLTNTHSSARITLSQIIDRPDSIGKTLTAVIEFVDGSKVFGSKVMPTTAGQNAVVQWITQNNSYIGFYNDGGYPAVWIAINASESYTIKNIALYEGEYTAETLPEYQPKGYKIEALDCGVLTVHKNATLSAGSWSSSAPYTQTVSVEGIAADDTPHVSPVYSDDNNVAIAQKEAWNMVSRAKTANKSITFYCFDEKPTVDIPVQIEVNR